VPSHLRGSLRRIIPIFSLLTLLNVALQAEDAMDAEVAKVIRQMAKAEVFRGSRLGDSNNTDYASPYVQGANALNPYGFAALPGLKKLLTDADPAVVIAAADMILSLGDASAYLEAAAALERLRPNLHEDNLGVAIYLLTRLTGKLPCELDPAKLGKNAFYRVLAWLRWYPNADAEKFALENLGNKDWELRQVSVWYLEPRCGPEASNACLKLLYTDSVEHTNVMVGQFMVAAKHCKPQALKPLIEGYLRSGDLNLLYPGIGAALDLKMEELLPQVELALKFFRAKPEEYASHLLQSKVLERLIAMNTASSHALLLKLCNDPLDNGREMAVRALGQWEDVQAVSTLKEAADDENPQVRAAAVKSLAALSFKFPDAEKALVEFSARKVRDHIDNRAVIIAWLTTGKLERAEAFFAALPKDKLISQMLMECAGDKDMQKHLDKKIATFFATALSTQPDERVRRIDLNNILQSFSKQPYTLLEPLLELSAHTRSWDVDSASGLPFPLRYFEAMKKLPPGEAELIKLVQSPNVAERAAAVCSLGQMGTAAALPALTKAAQDPSFSDGSMLNLSMSCLLWNNKLPAEAYLIRPHALAAIDAIKGRK